MEIVIEKSITGALWPEEMSIKVAQKWKILTPLQKLLKNVGDLGKLIVFFFQNGPFSASFSLFSSFQQ